MVTIIAGIISYNVKEKLAECITTVERHLAGVPIVVWDNGSDDGTVEMIRADFPRVTLYHCPENLFFARGCNELITRCKSRYTLLMNADIRLLDDSCTAIAEYLDARSEVIAASPSVRDKGVVRHMSSGIITPLECIARDSAWGILLRRRKAYRECMSSERDPYSVFDTAKITNCCCLVRNEPFLKMGGFSTRQILYWTEEDFAVRCGRKGWVQSVYGKSLVEHDHGSSTKKLPSSLVRALYVHDRLAYMRSLFGIPASILVEVALLRPRFWKSLVEYRRYFSHKKDIASIKERVNTFPVDSLLIMPYGE